MAHRDCINLDPEIVSNLRKYAFEKYGTTYGTVKKEAEEAIKKHIAGGVHG